MDCQPTFIVDTLVYLAFQGLLFWIAVMALGDRLMERILGMKQLTDIQPPSTVESKSLPPVSDMEFKTIDLQTKRIASVDFFRSDEL
ncbi:hypothetical protein [Merismopedia glauca]|uniref:Uncharacterized protein n=1 Tax=Merismopedia glauca CCAP 1448/3 TaxID=1296344 RepID=A0A2T1C3K0_9CYAN|nr:hypothetical protein [Merismopedia glauca]PSB02784.1 hypothetical protein C7B64_11570 [Merismopedia glauca CCAP 1448/3]